MLAASLTEGTTLITNAAKEPGDYRFTELFELYGRENRRRGNERCAD